MNVKDSLSLKNNISLFDKVRVVNRKGETIKEGVVVGLTSGGANIFQPKCDWPFADNMQFAEWFAFDAKESRIIPSKTVRRKHR